MEFRKWDNAKYVLYFYIFRLCFFFNINCFDFWFCWYIIFFTFRLSLLQNHIYANILNILRAHIKTFFVLRKQYYIFEITIYVDIFWFNILNFWYMTCANIFTFWELTFHIQNLNFWRENIVLYFWKILHIRVLIIIFMILNFGNTTIL